MIVEWFLGFCVWVGTFVFGLFPTEDAQATVSGLSGAIATVVSYTSGLGVWIPWALIGAAILFTFTAWAAIFVFKIVRQLLAHVPFFGGTG